MPAAKDRVRTDWRPLCSHTCRIEDSNIYNYYYWALIKARRDYESSNEAGATMYVLP
jgi:hypothetical protein